MNRPALVFGGWLLGLAGPLAVVPPAGQAQAPAPPQVTFRAGITYVEVDAIVTDARGAFVRDLRAEDFEVLEDGRPQAVTTFALVDIPFERADPLLHRDEEIEPGFFTNERDFEGRLYLLVLDANHVAPVRSALVKKVARQFVLDALAPNDQAAVVHIGRDDISQDFTSNKRLLLQSIDRFMGQKLRSPVLNKFDDVARTQGIDLEPRDRDAQERAALARQTLQSMEQLAGYLAGIRGRRKAMVLVSEGLDVNLTDTLGPSVGRIGYDLFRDNSSSEALLAAGLVLDMQAMVETATRAHVAVYAVDPRGLVSTPDELMELTGPPEGATLGGDPSKALGEELRRAQGLMRTWADETGGLAIVNTNAFDRGFADLVRHNSTYYLLGYQAAPTYDGKFHSITVRVKRPGLEVRARRGYHALRADPAAAGPPADPLRDLLTSPLPIAGLTLRAAASVFRGASGAPSVQIAVEVDGEHIDFAERGTSHAAAIDLAFLALDAGGQARGTARKTLDLVMRPESRDAVAEHGLRYATELELRPGRYQLRIAGRDTRSGREGAVFGDLEVPDFAAPLSMSGLVLTSARAGAAPTVNEAATLRAVLPGPPVVSREFDLEDTLIAFAEVYDTQAATPHRVDLSAIVRTDDGVEVFRHETVRDSREIDAARGGYGFVVTVPLEDLVPGRYALTLRARSRLAGEPVVREVEFRVR